jgi:hypothetical protein
VTLGTYPALAIAAAPEPWALLAGLVLFVGGVAWALLAVRVERRAYREASVSGLLSRQR